MEPAKSKKLSPLGKNILLAIIICGLLVFLVLPGSLFFPLLLVLSLAIFYYVFGLRYFFLLAAVILGCMILARNTELLILTVIIGGILFYYWLPSASQPSEKAELPQTPTDRLRILEEAYRQNLITKQEYLEKRQQILADF